VLLGLCRAVDRGAHGAHRGGPVAGLDHHLEALAIAQPEQRRRAEHVGPGSL
jgi:hypothetical protein